MPLLELLLYICDLVSRWVFWLLPTFHATYPWLYSLVFFTQFTVNTINQFFENIYPTNATQHTQQQSSVMSAEDAAAWDSFFDTQSSINDWRDEW